jgi:hypothetical protein
MAAGNRRRFCLDTQRYNGTTGHTMKFELVTLHALAVDGHTFAPGQTIATLETQFDVSNIVSAAHFGDVKFVAVGSPQTPPPADTKRVRRDRTTETKPAALEDNLEPEVNEYLHPDVLNAQPDPEHEPQPEQPKQYEVIGTTTLAGLPERIGRALVEAGFKDRNALVEYYKANQGFADVEGIGKAAERKIVVWLFGPEGPDGEE